MKAFWIGLPGSMNCSPYSYWVGQPESVKREFEDVMGVTVEECLASE
jgi:hypothetical protein